MKISHLKLIKTTLSIFALISASGFAFTGRLGNPGQPSENSQATSQKKIYSVLNFGVKGDGQSLNTEAIQAAIDTVHQQGGGKLLFPHGTYLTGSIVLKSHVELYLAKDAVLLGTTNPHAYKRLNRWQAMILAENQTDLAITGKGTINVQGQQVALNVDSLFYIGELDSAYYNLRRKRPHESARPQSIEMVSCSNIRVTGITIKEAASWVQTYDKCTNLVIDSIRVDSDAYWNNDGVDISDCKNVRITNSHINATDDGICLKSHDAEAVNDSIYIANCTIRTSASAIKFGTASRGGFKNVTIENIKVYDTYRSAIALESVDGGILENIDISNVEAVNTGNAIFIRLGHRNQDSEVGTLKNIRIRNVKVQVPFERPDKDYDLRGPDLWFFHNPFPASITGIPNHVVENVILENIEISYPGRANKGMAYIPLNRLHDVPENEADYPEFHMFGELPAWGLYVRHVKGLTLKNVKMRVEEPDFRPAYVFDDVRDLTLAGLEIYPTTGARQIVFKDVHQARVENIKVKGAPNDVLQLGTCSDIIAK